jgi:DHA1 family tetracycline resistance protein-like MFS transporter
MEKVQKSKASILFIIFTVTLDAMGIGLIMPVVPGLIREIQGTNLSNAAFWGGLLSFSYASMQFLFGPLLGNLSDRYGRRPILITSLFFMGIDYLLMAIAPTIFLLFLARIVSGITGATFATANAFLADTSERGDRSRNFGLVGAAFGVGFVIGPAIGGLLGEYGIRVPFLVAGGLALLNALFGLLVLPETLPKSKRRPFEMKRANPFSAIARLRHFPEIGGLMLIVLLYVIANQVYPSIWAYFTIERFEWSLRTIGLSLAVYGVSAAFIQIFVLKRMLEKFGEEKTAAFGIIIGIATFCTIMFLTGGKTMLLMMPIAALGEMVGPSLQGMMADRVNDDEQGELQGIFTSVISIGTIISPLLMTNVFKIYSAPDAAVYFPAAPFAISAILATAALCLLLYTSASRRATSDR